MIDNDKVGYPSYRSTPEFFERTMEVRRILEGSQ